MAPNRNGPCLAYLVSLVWLDIFIFCSSRQMTDALSRATRLYYTLIRELNYSSVCDYKSSGLVPVDSKEMGRAELLVKCQAMFM